MNRSVLRRQGGLVVGWSRAPIVSDSIFTNLHFSSARLTRALCCLETFMKILAGILVAITLAIVFAIPTSVTLNVGDDGNRVHEVGRYGYGKSIFSLAPSNDEDGARLYPSAFSIGGGWHLLVMHNHRINSMTHFGYEQHVPLSLIQICRCQRRG